MNPQQSVFSKPWYWILIGFGALVFVVLISLTIAIAARSQASSATPGASQEQVPLSYGDGSSLTAPLPLGTDIEMTYSNDFESGTLVDLTATVRVTKVNLDATAEALAEDPWADLMLDANTKLAIVDLEITNHADDESLSLLLEGRLVLEDSTGATYTMDIVQIALDQAEVPGLDFPKDETVHAVAVYFIPATSNASNIAVRLDTSSGTDVPTQIYVATK